MGLNEKIFLFLNQLAGQSTATDWLILFIAEYLGWVLVGMLIIHYVDHRRSRRSYQELAVVLLSAALAWGLALILKLIYASSRPYLSLSEATQLVFTTTTYAFPSGHTAFFTALGAALTYYHRRLGLLYFAAAFLVGVARVVAAVHWPADILAGAALGTLVGLAIIRLAK